MKCVIFSAAKIADYGFITSDEYSNALIICADAGYEHVKHLGLTPQLIVGDFDSLGQAPKIEAEIIHHPAEKDDTDTMLAVKVAIERGATEIVIFGGIGDRLDHTYANISTLLYASLHGAKACLKASNCKVMLHTNASEIQISRGNWDFVSLFAYSDKCEGVSIQGVKYPLADATLTTDFPLGVSNEFAGEHAVISVKSGYLLIMLTRE
ncbi:MAG TPA: thiamine diphosphokinase [Oscillospiraceae bacterium]|nr:thiamine diphosphokinase [Oscillospiraceae bacterium]